MRHRFMLVLFIFLIRAAVLAAGEINFETDIEFSNPDDQHLKLNMASPKDGDGPFPTVVCIHGGGFRAGKREGHDGTCKKLAARGYVAITVTYRLAPKYQFPAAVYDVKAAVRFLRANAAKYKIDPQRIAAWGDSAGGHLALFLGVTGDVKDFEGPGEIRSSQAQCNASSVIMVRATSHSHTAKAKTPRKCCPCFSAAT